MRSNMLLNALLMLSILLITTVVISHKAFALDKCAYLVLDHADIDWDIARKFRTDYGMAVSASGQFSEEELHKLLSSIPTPKQHIWILDLRQESHGFINGIPVTWYARRNSANIHRNAKEIEANEQKLLNQLSHQPIATVYTIKKLPNGEFRPENPQQIKIKTVQSEQQLVASVGANYYRFYVLDHHRPDDQTVDEYVKFIKHKVQPDDWLHFHCRGGKGRSSTFIAMLDIIKHAATTSFDEIMQRQVDMGNINLDAVSNKPEKRWKAKASKERYQFLQKFFTYVKDPEGYAKRSWSEWLQLSKSSKSKPCKK